MQQEGCLVAGQCGSMLPVASCREVRGPRSWWQPQRGRHIGTWDAIMLASVWVLVDRLDECCHVVTQKECKPSFDTLWDVSQGAERKHGRD